MYSFSDEEFQNFPHPTVKIYELILLYFRTVHKVSCGDFKY
jgi:hypothetical protein